MSTLSVQASGEIEVDWKDLHDLQVLDDGRSLKATDPDKIKKLVASLKKYGLVTPLQVWIDPDTKRVHCFDAHHRRKALTRLEKEGWVIPLLPATRCLAATRAQARELLLIKESKSSWVDTYVLHDYAVDLGLNPATFCEFVDLPEIKWDMFAPATPREETPKKTPSTPKTAPVEKRQIVIMCRDDLHQEELYYRLTNEGESCRLLNS
jgi:hypothetical protein